MYSTQSQSRAMSRLRKVMQQEIGHVMATLKAKEKESLKPRLVSSMDHLPFGAQSKTGMGSISTYINLEA